MTRLWEVNEPPWTAQAPLGSTYTWAMRVNCVSDTSVARIGFFRAAENVAPVAVVLYRADTQAVVFRDDSPTIGPVGSWSWTECDAGINLVNGVSYRVCIVAGGTCGVAKGNIGAPAPPSPLSFSGSPPYHYATSDAFPSSSGGVSTYLGIDLETGTPGIPDADPPPDGEPDPGTLNPGGSLAYWLHKETPNLDSAVKVLYDWWALDRLVLTAARDAIDDWNDRAGVLFGTSGVVLGGLLAARLDSLLATMDAVDAAIAELGTPAQVSDVTAVGEALADLAVDVGDIRNTTPWPGTGWVKTGETTFEGCLAWEQQADLYVVGFTAIPDNVGTTEACGVTLYHRLAWASEKNGDHIGERRYIEFQNALVENNGRRMNGLLLVAKPLTEGTVEAWQINP